MTDPHRLVDDPATCELGRALIASAHGDAPDHGSRSAVAKRLGLGATLTGTAHAGVAAALWWKIAVVAIVLGGGAAIVARSADGVQSVALEVAPPHARPRDDIAAIPTPARTQTPEPQPPLDRAAAKPPSRNVAAQSPRAQPPPAQPIESTSPVEPPSTPREAEVPEDVRRLAAEVAVLDRARTALRARDIASAIAALDQHQREFANGALVAEAEVIQIEAMIQAGRDQAAHDRARAFAAAFPGSPLLRRVRSLIERLSRRDP